MRRFKGWSLTALLRDLRFDFRHRSSFSKIAVVGDRRWHQWSTYAAVPIFKAKLRYFRANEEPYAIAWLRQITAD
ncbi:MAG: STAS/SEC14 domain-containing protein [Sphingomonas sp.]|nr:STAS/SEC14 domain-containing protein [Sphingomonas sp.]